ncbi:MAG TPA: hypothetical protein VM243_00140 [Phycisphaerae bacterium]|nr:hypothetical protein [Phycisphaerae bacterium]
MGDILRTLEAVEERSQIEILSDLFTASADVVRLRIPEAEGSDGTIPIEEGAQVIQKARDMMMAAACAAIDRRPYFPTRKPNKATEYLRKVRMGQTERGSYVVTIISPVAPALAPGEGERLFEVEDPFERQVTTTLAQALAAMQGAAEQAAATGNLTAFQDAVPKGVTANLCDAVAGFCRGEGYRGLNVAFSWSRSRPVATGVAREISLEPDAMPMIEEAGRVFRETSDLDDFELRGPVVKLERGEGEATGKVTVLGFVDDQPRKIKLELPETEYLTAIQAHKQQQTVNCYGVLVREGKSFRLSNPRRLVVEPDD